MDMESMKKLKSSVEKCLDELAKKSDLSPAETKAALDGMELREMLKCEIEDCKMKEDKEYSERGYSGHDVPYRQYHITSYGMPFRMTNADGSYHTMRGSYEGTGGNGGYSGDYGVNGWYRSNSAPDMRFDSPEYSERHGYSRHSIGDRVVEKLEHMMDKTDSDYEREELRKFMKMIRSAAD